MNVTKLHFKNLDPLRNQKDQSFSLSKKRKTGTMILSLFLASAVVTGVNEHFQKQDTYVDSIIPTTSISMKTDDINSLNIILNDCDCSDTLFQEVCDCLKNDGLQFQETSQNYNINQPDCTVVTLDQQYSAGSSTLIFAPYNNTRVGHSDSLAISMQTAFDQNGFLVDHILCSQIGYSKDENGNVQETMPTPAEQAIDEDMSTSFVTISFGTQNINAQWVAKSIENGLARQKYYIDNYDNQTDLIYRANSSDFLDNVANYFDADSSQITVYNGMDSNQFRDGQAVVNPNVSHMDVFNRDRLFDVDGVKTRAY